MGKKTILEINGHRYDANSGAALGPTHTKHSQQHLHTKQLNDVVRAPAASSKAHKPASSRTLMRHVVKKPASQSKRVKVQAQLDTFAIQSNSATLFKPSVKRLDAKRLAKARRINKSQAISHFGSLSAATERARAAVAAKQTSTRQERRVAANSVSAPLTPAARTAALMERAVERASLPEHSAQSTKRHKKSRRAHFATTGGAIVVLALIVGVVATYTLPKVELQMAAAKAGFQAQLPSHKPQGYEVQALSSSKGSIQASYISSVDNSSYSLVQKKSQWDSASLEKQYVKTVASRYETIQSASRKIYIYGQNATWVSGGIWYKLQNNGALSNQEIVKLANSL